ncbi:MAG: hypothetical protein GX458_19390 [Phyllobacteriaceae bacterium]|nr:hypothetical protein [Phyllobacteriaceae bacterium]
MPLYMIVMGMYTVLTAYILYLVFTIVLRSKNIWEQIISIIIIVPFAMRLFFIK